MNLKFQVFKTGKKSARIHIRTYYTQLVQYSNEFMFRRTQKEKTIVKSKH